MFTFITSLGAIVSTILAATYYNRSKVFLHKLVKEEKNSHTLKERLEDGWRDRQELAGRIRTLEWEQRNDTSNQRDLIERLRTEAVEYRKELKEAKKIIREYTHSDITSIKFTAHIPDDGWKRTEFKLGIGSCGEQVTCLHWVEHDDRYLLTQTCTDGERKEFTYYKKDVAGRIEIARKVADNTTH